MRLYTMAEVISSIWENIPPILMGVLLDLVNHEKAGFSLDSIYISMGVVTVAVGGVLAMFFCLRTKERVTQASQEHVSYREGLRIILHNKPLLLIMITDFFGFFAADTWEHYYYIDVLGSATLRNLVRLPGGPLSFLSYTYINKVRERFPIKTLWIFGSHIKDLFSLLTFIVGSVGGLYQNVGLMAGLLMVRNLAYMGTLSVKKIIPREVMLDALEYAEWKNGYRSEGTILAAKSMVKKIVANVVNSMTTLIMKRTGYSLNAGFGRQSQRAKYALFAMSMGIPAATGIMAMIPKLFYDLTGEKRTRMYEELAEMRKARQVQYDYVL